MGVGGKRMKNKYEKLLENIELKDDPKDQIRQAVYNYDEKVKEKYIGIKVVLAICSVVLIAFIPSFNHSLNTNNNSFTVKADESIYDIQKGELVLNDFDMSSYDGASMTLNLMPKNENTIVMRYFTTIPNSIYVEGKNIDTVSYQLNQGYFVRLKETEDPTDLSNRGIYPRSKNSTGHFTSKKTDIINYMMEKGFDVSGDVTKTCWELLAGKPKITVPYEEQNAVNNLYAINPVVLYKDLSEDEKQLWVDKQENDHYIYETIDFNKKMFEVLNKMEMEIRVDYKDGTFETTKVKLKFDENTFKLSFQNKNNN